jgi:hypothetical protein
MFDNGVSNLYIKWNTIKSGAIAGLIGIVAGAVVSKLWNRRWAQPETEM